jgi:hypothetical protein
VLLQMHGEKRRNVKTYCDMFGTQEFSYNDRLVALTKNFV